MSSMEKVSLFLLLSIVFLVVLLDATMDKIPLVVEGIAILGFLISCVLFGHGED